MLRHLFHGSVCRVHLQRFPLFYAVISDKVVPSVAQKNKHCADLKWVPFDEQISPTDNLYNNPNDLDAQPEYPLRTEMKYYKQVEQLIVPPTNLDAVMSAGAVDTARGLGQQAPVVQKSPFPPASTMITLWVIGLVLWCFCFLSSGKRAARRKKSGGFKSV